MDRASLLRPDTRSALEQELAAFEAKTGHQIVVHVTPSLEGLPIEDYSMQVAEAWRIGQKGLDNGVILTIAPNERELRIEVGYGLEGVLPDAIAARIRDQILTSFREGRFDEGVVAGVGALMSVTQGEVLPLPAKRERDGPPVFPMLLFLFLCFYLMSRGGPFWWALLGAAQSGRSWGTGYGRGGFGGSSWGGGGGFGGGGFSGGGGGFGGGGASGRW
jgi:uncharacterized protein